MNDTGSLPQGSDAADIAPPLLFLEALKALQAQLVLAQGVSPEGSGVSEDQALLEAAEKKAAAIKELAAKIQTASKEQVVKLRQQMRGREPDDAAAEIANLPAETEVDRMVATWARAAFEQEFSSPPPANDPPPAPVRRAPRPRQRQRQSAPPARRSHTAPAAAPAGDDGPTPPPDAPPPPGSGRSAQAPHGEGGAR